MSRMHFLSCLSNKTAFDHSHQKIQNNRDGEIKSHLWNCVKEKASFEHIEVIDTRTKILHHLCTLEV